MRNGLLAACVALVWLAAALPAVAQSGACGGLAGIQCAQGEFCDYGATGSCGAGDRQGVCQPVPQFCTMNYDPVCGCDGQIHSNACMANGAGTSVAPPKHCAAAEEGSRRP